jgi:hypothetical protein
MRIRRWIVGCLVGLGVALLLVVPAFASGLFPDVPSSHPYVGAIEDLANKGIIGGYTNGNFGPSDLVKRQQFAKMIVLTGGYPVSESDTCLFADVAKSDATTFYPDNFVAVCAAHGITTGKTATVFDPSGKITRYQVVSMVVRTADDLQPGLLANPPVGWAAAGSWGNDATHGANARRAEYNGLLAGLDLASLSPMGNMNRGEVAQVLHNLLGKLTPTTTTTTASRPTTTARPTTTTTVPAKVGTQQNPVHVGQEAQVGDWRIEVLGVTLNATQAVLAENMFNDPPAPGSQYVLVNLRATYTGQSSDTFWIGTSCRFVGSRGNTFSWGGAVAPNSILDYGEMFPGASATGNLLYEVPSDQVYGGLLMVEDSPDFNHATRTFFAIQ